MRWSLNSFNLIVFGNSDQTIFSHQSGSAWFEQARLFEFTSAQLRARYKSNLQALSDLPTLVLGEVGDARTPPAFLTRISDIEVQSNRISFQFDHLLDGFNSEQVFNCEHFNIETSATGIDERNRTHWAVKRGNVIEGLGKLLKEQFIGKRPELFNILEWPLPVLGHIAVMMPFDTSFDLVYEAIRLACASQGKEALRVDQIYSATPIIKDIFESIAQSSLVIGDLSGRNPNVLYEIGLAHVLKRDVIMIVQNGEDIPFDLRHLRYFTYSPDSQGIETLKTSLERSIKATSIVL